MMQCKGAYGYPILVFIATVLLLFFRFWMIDNMDTVLAKIGSHSSCTDVLDSDARHACFGNQLVYRMGFALVLFFSLMMMLVMACRKAVHEGAWLIKIVVIIGTFVGSIWIDDDKMLGFADACLYGSALFIVVQIICLLEWVYGWNEAWAAKAWVSDGMGEETTTEYATYLMCTTVVGYIVSLVFIILSIVQFAAEGCQFAAAQISWTCIACVLFSVLSVSGISEYGSLLCSSMVSLYASYYCWSALSGMGKDIVGADGNSCNTLLSAGDNAGVGVNVFFGLVLTCLSLAFSAWTTASESGSDLSLHNTSHTGQVADEESGREGGRAGAAYQRMEGESTEIEFGGTEVIKPLMLFHFIMCICCMFMVMTVVNWDTSQTTAKATLQDFGTGTTVMWVKTLSQWLTIVLYVWSIVAQRVLAACGVEREFDFT